MHHAQMHEFNSFITLTYKEAAWSLEYGDFQRFMKRLRSRCAPVTVSYYVAGEYGERNSRAHFHACLFGTDFADKRYFRKSGSGEKIYTSERLESLWPHGFSSVGSLTFESAAYVARYVMKKHDVGSDMDEILDPDTGEVFVRAKPFCRMSLKHPIGKSWIKKYKDDVYPRGTVVVNGREQKAPRYYDRYYRSVDAGGAMELSLRRGAIADKYFGEQLPGRLDAREQVSLAKSKLLKREL